MRYKRAGAFIIAGIILSASCAENRDKDTAATTNTAIITEAPTSTEIPEITSVSVTAETGSAETSETVTSSQEITTDSEFTIPDDGNGYPERLYIKDFISPKLADKADDIMRTREEFSVNNRFIDYEFITEPETSDIPDETKKKAEALAADEQAYKKAAEDIYLLDPFSTYDLIAAGEASPEFDRAYEYDFDGEPGNERFIIVSVPQLNNDSVIMSDLLIFENSGGDMSIVGFVDSCQTIYILDYGTFRQFVFGGHGLFGMRDHIAVYGVISGKPKVLIDNRIRIDESSKIGCFLYHSGIREYNELMVYDKNTNGYRTIYGYPADTRKLKALNIYNDIDEFDRIDIPDDSTAFFVVGEKYLLGRGGLRSYVYENGRFSPYYLLGLPMMFLDDGSDVEWFDVDVDYAFSVSGVEIG